MKLKKFLSWTLAVCLSVMLVAPPTTAYAGTLTPAPASDVIVTGTGVTASAGYTLNDLQKLAGVDAETSYTYSGFNSSDFGHVYTVNGIKLSTLLAASQPVSTDPLNQSITCLCSDGTPFVFNGSGNIPLLSTPLYYFPGMENGNVTDATGAVQVPPVLTWSGTDTQTYPVATATQAFGSQPRLVFGQSSPQGINISFFPKVVTQIVVGAQNNATALTVNGHSYTAADVLQMPAVTGSFYPSKTVYAKGVALSELLAGVADTDTVTFTISDTWSDISNYTMTKAELIANNAMLAYASSSTPDGALMPIGSSSTGLDPTLYLDSLQGAKHIIGITTSSTPATSVNVAISPTTASVQVGSTTQLTATVTPATAGGVTWSSSDNAVATVNSAGIVTGVVPGMATITATSVSDPTKQATATITVTSVPTAPIVLIVGDGITSTSYTLQQLQALPPSTGSYSYTSSGNVVTTYVQGISIADLLASFKGYDTVSFTVADGYSGAAAYNGYTVAELIADNAILAYASGTSPDNLAIITSPQYGDLPSLFVSSIGGGKPDKLINAVTVARTPVTVALDATSASVQEGKTFQLTATVTPAAAGDVTWTSSNPAIATVSATGLVTALSPGAAIITATSQSDLSQSAQAVITVTAEPVVLTVKNGAATTAYTLSQLEALAPAAGSYTYTTNAGSRTDYVKGVSLATLLAGTSDQAVVTFTAADNTDVSSFTMTKAQLAAANAVLAYEKGTSADNLAPITDSTYGSAPTLYLDGTLPAKFISAFQAVEPVVVTVSPKTVSINEGSVSSVTADVTPASANKGVTWTSSDPAVAMVSSGFIVGLTPGTATLTATSVDDPTKSDAVTVTVLAVPVSVTIAPSSLALTVGGQSKATATVTPSRMLGGVTWSVEDTSVATVDPVTGTVTAVGVGTTRLTATSNDDPSKSATITVTVTASSVGPGQGGSTESTKTSTTPSSTLPKTGDAIVSFMRIISVFAVAVLVLGAALRRRRESY